MSQELGVLRCVFLISSRVHPSEVAIRGRRLICRSQPPIVPDDPSSLAASQPQVTWYLCPHEDLYEVYNTCNSSYKLQPYCGDDPERGLYSSPRPPSRRPNRFRTPSPNSSDRLRGMRPYATDECDMSLSNEQAKRIDQATIPPTAPFQSSS